MSRIAQQSNSSGSFSNHPTSLIDHHEEEGLLLNAESHPPSQPSTETESSIVTEHKRGGRLCLKVFVAFLYLLLIGGCLSVGYFNFLIYQKYIAQSIMIDGTLNSTQLSIGEKWAKMNSSIHDFIVHQTDQLQKFKSQLGQLEGALQDIKKESQYRFDKVQLLSIKNSEELAQMETIANQQKAYADQIVEYHKAVDINTKNNIVFVRGQRQDMTRIESIAWLYTDNYSKDDQYLNQLYLDNVKNYAYKSSFQIKFINKNNYLYYLSIESLNKLSSIFGILEKRLSNHDRSNLGDHIQTIKRVLIMVAILYEHGGAIFIDNVALTEPLDWLHNVNILKGFDHFKDEMPPQVISFHNNYYSDKLTTINSGFFKQIYEFPNIQRYFLAAIKKSEFVGLFLEEMIAILKTPINLKKQISDNYSMGILNGNDPYYEFFYIAAHMVIQKKQKELNKISKEDNKLYAVDYFGLYTINCQVGPMKLKTYFKGETDTYVYNNLMDITRKEFEDKVGPIRYLHIFNNYNDANRELLKIRQNNRRILKDSFIHQMFFFTNDVFSQRYSYNRLQDYSQTTKPWSSLPKKLWIYSNGQENNQILKLIMQSNAKINKQAGIEVLVVNSKVISLYLSKDVLNDVTDKFRNSRFSYSQPLKDYTLMLCLLASQGGVYIDSSYLLMQDLQWIYNIHQVNPRLLVNRMGETPKMLMFHNNHNRRNYAYTFDTALHSRFDDHLSYQKSFVAVEKDSILLQTWIQQILKGIALPNDKLDQKFMECGMIGDEIQYKRNIQMLPIDILKCIYIKGLREVKSQNYGKETNPYNLWSIDGDYSVYKLRQNANYENVDHGENKFITNFAKYQTEQRIGQIFKMIRIDDVNLGFLNRIYSERGDTPFKSAHKESIFAKYFLIKN